MPASKTPAKPADKETKKAAAVAAAEPTEAVKKKPGRPPKAGAAAETKPATGAKRGRKPKAATDTGPADDLDMSDIEAVVRKPEFKTRKALRRLWSRLRYLAY